MKVNGFLLREAIKIWELRRDTVLQEFTASMTAFPGEAKSPTQIAATLQTQELNIAELQTAQTRYNLQTHVVAGTERLSLCEAVKQLGGVTRIEAAWRAAAKMAKTSSWVESPNTRKTNEVYAIRTISYVDAAQEAARWSRITSTLRAAIARGNGTEYDAADLKVRPELLRE